MTTMTDLKEIPLLQSGFQKTRSVCGYCGVGCAVDILTRDNRIIGIQPAASAAWWRNMAATPSMASPLAARPAKPIT
jgi:predicted molibdopterin-dependent oxidoreductase YjgC